jgi:hypothetical protein
LVYPALYNGPVNYYARLIREQEIKLEQHDHYTKQTYRNRFTIMGPNGILTLTVPVSRKRGMKTLMKDVRVDYDTPWNKIHWRSLVASYTASPYFALMMDELQPFYAGKFKFLIDLNLGLLQTTLDLLGIDSRVILSDAFTPITENADPRKVIHPKLDISSFDPVFHPVAYHQVFSDRHGFLPNLSVLDLLFNQGSDAIGILQKCIRT